MNGVKTDLETAGRTTCRWPRGEFGTLIAKNHDEIDELRRLGERNYYEFTLTGKGQRAKVGGMTVELRDTNDKKKTFTLAMYVDDMRLEKKNRSLDEPIYFYRSRYAGSARAGGEHRGQEQSRGLRERTEGSAIGAERKPKQLDRL